ncbi:MAG: hypothetical protein E8A46_01870 [Bradyrhizobium sp.]|uniref:hypothetical protein n=1 Tax=Bradyrhizobium sp. TaxID=376 RepID=UPI001204CF92|nr:hypothetical protein [Bradyrhizobium sp.]THD57117.1 MAG: hypothetical protein E8A46_01870 [Bradyrhizobium sp.]
MLPRQFTEIGQPVSYGRHGIRRDNIVSSIEGSHDLVGRLNFGARGQIEKQIVIDRARGDILGEESITRTPIFL